MRFRPKDLFFTVLVVLLLSVGASPAVAQEDDHQKHDQSDAFWAGLARNRTGRYVIGAGELKAASPADLEDVGHWGPVIEWPHVPVSAANLPDGRVITWASNERTRFPAGPEFTFSAVWDVTTGVFQETPNHTHDMFCSHMVMLEDGRLMVNGGRNHVKTTSIFDFTTNAWSTIDPMVHGRWYPTTVAMPDGTVFTASGSGQPNAPGTAELWTEGAGWDELSGIDWQTIVNEPGFETYWWPHVFVDPRGDLFQAGPTPNMHVATTSGEGTLTDLGPWLSNGWFSKHAAIAMYEEGRLLIAGGAASNGPSTNRALIMDINGPSPVVTEIASMEHPRRFASAVILPNGEVLVVGGNTSGIKFSDDGAILPAEIWNPDTQLWRTVASISEPRNYHSVALLLESGEVLSAGGGLCGCPADHQDGQVFSPPYLFDSAGDPAVRPEILDAPAALGFDQPLSIQASGDVAYFSMIKASATTHSVNTDQRHLRMPIGSKTGDVYDLRSHGNPNVMTPGYWMLFAVDSQGVPSSGRSVRVSSNLTPFITSASDQFSREGETISHQIEAVSPNGDPLTFSAQGLPPGLTFDPASGLITGTIDGDSIGKYEVDLAISVGGDSHGVQIDWYVHSAISGSILREWWIGIPGTDLDLLTGDFYYPDSPSGSDYLDSFEAPTDWGNTYGQRVSGYLHPVESGTYKFWMASDDEGELWLSTTDDPNDVQLIASVSTFTLPRQWTTFPEQASDDIELEAGMTYYIEAIHKEAGGGDNLAVAWQAPGGPREVIPGLFLSPFNKPPIVGTPTNQASLVGGTVLLGVVASDPEGDPLAYSASNLPVGLGIDGDSGVISGSPTAAGEFQTSVAVTDGFGSTSVQFVWTVDSAAAPLEITGATSTPAQVGSAASLGVSIAGSEIVSVAWTFGDGATETGGLTATHFYTAAGRYPVSAVVTSGTQSERIDLFQNVFAPLTAAPARSSMGMAVDAQGRVWSVNPDHNSVTVTDPQTLSRIAEIPVGVEPRSLVVGNQGTVFVTNRLSATVSQISTSSLVRELDFSLPYASRPYGMVINAAGTEAFITLEATGRVARLDLASGSVDLSAPLGSRLRHLSINGSGSTLYVARFITPPLQGESTAAVSTAGGGELLLVDTGSLGLQKTITLAYNAALDTPDSARGVANYLVTPTVSPDGARLWLPSKFDNIFRGRLRDGLDRQHDRLVRSGVSVIDLATGQEVGTARMDIDDQSPSVAAAFGPRGNVLFLAHAGSRTITAVDPILGQAITRIVVGRAPSALALSNDGRFLYVHNYLDRTIQALDVSELTFGGGGIAFTSIGTSDAVGVEALDANVLRGKQLFNDAFDDRLAGEDYLSCSVCHDGGGQDGRVWDLTDGGEGLRNTIDLNGRGGTDHGRVHWTANFDEIHDFENDIRGVFGGTGLLSNVDFAATEATLGAPKAGRSADLDALAAYVSSLTRAGESPFRNLDGSLSAQAELGKDVFRAAGCVACHGGTRFTDSPTNALHDIGTIRSASGQRLGGALTGFDTPTLRGSWNNAPYLHDGSAPTLAAAVQAHNGITLSQTQLQSLVSYLESIDDEEVAAPATGTPPSIVAVPDQTTLVGLSVDFDLAATDEQSDSITFGASGLPDGLTIDSSGAVSGIPTLVGVFDVTARATDIDGSDTVQFVWRVLQADLPVASTCYLIADNSERPDVVTSLIDGTETVIGSTGTVNIEGIAFSQRLGQLFAANQNELGLIDLTDGAFRSLGEFGSGNGSAGANRSLSDVDGLAFDPVSGVLFGVAIKTNEPDLLFTINPATGAVIRNGFGPNQDYVLVQGVDGIDDVDDIAVHPQTGIMYAVGTGDGVGTILFVIDKQSGAVNVIGGVDASTVEGLGFTPDGQLLGTTGDFGETVVLIDKLTGETETTATLGAGGTDYESIDCLGPLAQNIFAGRVFEDRDENLQYGSGDRGQSGAKLDFYRDENESRTVDDQDTFLTSVTTNHVGQFELRLGSTGAFVAEIDYRSLPPGATPLSDNVAYATFVSEGDVDLENLFPFALDRTESDLFCYLVADEGSGLSGGDVLTRLNKASLSEEAVGATGTSVIEAMAFNPQQTALFAANGKRLGTIDVMTGRFREIGRFGEGSGSAGVIEFDDVDGLAFDPNTGVLYGAVRRQTQPDLLIEVDVVTGSAVAGAFGGADYVVLETVDGRHDIDDLAIDPVDGSMYAILNGDSGNGRFVLIDRETGETTALADLDDDALEGLTFDGDGTLLATRGSNFQQVVVLDRFSGTTTIKASIGVDGHEDYEAIACLTNQTNKTSGRTYTDLNGSSSFDLADTIVPGVQVALYRDSNESGQLEGTDVLLATEWTDFDGRYAFETASRGQFIIAVLAGGYVSSSQTQFVQFEAFGTSALHNDIAVASGVTTDASSEQELPSEFLLRANYPNPFNPITTISYDLANSSHVVVSVFDLTGREIETLVNQTLAAGSHEVTFDAHALPSGVYFYSLVAGGRVITRSMVLMK